MITQAQTKQVPVSYHSFAEVGSHLVAYRMNPFRFELSLSGSDIQSPHIVYLQSDVNDAKALVEHIKAQSLANAEMWTPAQLQAIAGTQTLFIIYEDAFRMYLRPSKEIVTFEELQEQNPESKIFVSYDISDTGLITLVDQLLSWME